MTREQPDAFRRSRQDPSGKETTVTGIASRFGQDLEPREEYVADGVRAEGPQPNAFRYETESPERPSLEVVRDHQIRVRAGDLDRDFEENYAEDCVLVTGTGVHQGREAVRDVLVALDQRLIGSAVESRSCFVHGELAFAEWEAVSPSGERISAAETFVIRGGRIVAQTLHYEAQ